MTAQRCDGTPYVTGVIPDGMTAHRHAVSVRDSGADETALIAVGGGGAIVALAVAPYRRQKDHRGRTEPALRPWFVTVVTSQVSLRGRAAVLVDLPTPPLRFPSVKIMSRTLTA